ncbi:hypothetical protein PANT111_190003 [Pantoea brenneri]|uniref:Uncharacterized protein n=1 Tax=Pantoea brenneri TaxID=472694 RepID=A0AAX3J619_9GAMM|nr:hypothetical protein PANT111_190003 [Pantoea brenneri]
MLSVTAPGKIERLECQTDYAFCNRAQRVKKAIAPAAEISKLRAINRFLCSSVGRTADC